MIYTKSIRYPLTFDTVSGKTELDSTTISINRCIGLILLTGKGELLGDPDFGCRLYEMLFEQYSDVTEREIKTEIVESIRTYEKRITVSENNISITHIEDTDRNAYKITISYVVKNSPKQQETTVYLEEGSSLNNG